MQYSWLAIFSLTQFASYLYTFGPLVHASLLSKTFSQPAKVAVIQASAAVVSLILSTYFKKFLNLKYLITLSFLVASAGFALSFLEGQHYLFFVFTRLVLAAQISSFLLSQIPRLVPKNIQSTNKVLQQATVIVGLFAAAFVPAFAHDIRIIFLCDFLLTAGCLAASYKQLEGFSFKEIPSNDIKFKQGLTLNEIRALFLSLAVTLCIWVIGGLFTVIEIPLLMQRFEAKSSMISMVFICTIIFNLIALTIFSNRLITRNNLLTQGLAFFGVSLAAFSYVNIPNLYVTWASVMLIGFANGAFNLAQTSLIQQIQISKIRLNVFISSKVATNAGLVIGAVIAANVQILPVNHSKEFIKHNEARVLISNLPPEVIPYKLNDTNSMLISKQVFQNLFKYDEFNSLKPQLASSVQWKDSGKTLIVSVNNTVKFSDGSFLNSNDVRDALVEIKNAMGKEGEWAFGELNSIKTLDANKIQFKFNKSYYLFPSILAAPSFGIFKRKANEVIGTGDYSVSVVKNKIIVLKAVSNQLPNQITFTTLFEPNVQYDIVDEKISDNTNSYIKFRYKTLHTVLAILNNHTSTFASKKTRCLFLNIFEQEANNAYKAWDPVELGLPFSWNLFRKEKLRAEKLTLDKPIEVLYLNSAARFETEYNKIISDAMLKLHINVKFTEKNVPEILSRARAGKFDVLLLGYIPDFIHPDALLSPLVKTNQTYNFSKYSNSTVDRNLTLASTVQNKAEQIELYKKIITQIADDCPLSYLGTQTSEILVAKNIVMPVIGQLGLFTMEFAQLKWINTNER